MRNTTPIQVVAINMETGERKLCQSVNSASEKVLFIWKKNGSQEIRACINRRPHRSGWFFVYRDREEDLQPLIETWRSKWKREKARFGEHAEKRLVSLRIDAKTVIMVTPDKANEEYRQQWIERHERDSHSTRGNSYSRDIHDKNDQLSMKGKRK